jgi:hypothetical protein
MLLRNKELLRGLWKKASLWQKPLLLYKPSLLFGLSPHVFDLPFVAPMIEQSYR